MTLINTRNRLLLMAAPLSVPAVVASSAMHAPDLVSGLIAGVGIGLSLLGVLLLRRRA